MDSDVAVDVTALAIDVAVPEALRWADTRRGEQFRLSTLRADPGSRRHPGVLSRG